MSMVNTTPSTGKRTAVHFNMNRLRLQPGDRVIYWSVTDECMKIDDIAAYHGTSGNWFTVDGETVFVTDMFARVPKKRDEPAIIAAFAEPGRRTLATHERAALCRKYRLDG